MASLKESRTEDNLRRAFLDAALSDTQYSRCAQAARSAGHHALADEIQTIADHEARIARGYLDFVVSDDIQEIHGNAICDLTAYVAAMRDAHIATYAGMARTAHEEGFDDIADWFEMLAKAGRSETHRLRQALQQSREMRRSDIA